MSPWPLPFHSSSLIFSATVMRAPAKSPDSACAITMASRTCESDAFHPVGRDKSGRDVSGIRLADAELVERTRIGRGIVGDELAVGLPGGLSPSGLDLGPAKLADRVESPIGIRHRPGSAVGIIPGARLRLDQRDLPQRDAANLRRHSDARIRFSPRRCRRAAPRPGRGLALASSFFGPVRERRDEGPRRRSRNRPAPARSPPRRRHREPGMLPAVISPDQGMDLPLRCLDRFHGPHRGGRVARLASAIAIFHRAGAGH